MFKHINYNKFLIIYFMFLCLFSACSSSNVETLTETAPTVSVVYDQVEPSAPSSVDINEQTLIMAAFDEYDALVQEAGQYARFNKTIIGDTAYYIDREEFSSEECADIIYQLNEAVLLLQDELNLSSFEAFNVYISSKMVTQGIKGSVFINSRDINTLEALTAVMSGIYGELVNYGLCYGLSMYLCQKLEWNTEELYAAEEQLTDYFSKNENIALLDFAIPMFETIYFTEDDNLYAVSAAYYFTQFVIARHGIDKLASLISESPELTLDFDIQYTEICNEWLLNIGASCSRETPESAIRCIKNYERSNASYEYIFHTKDMRSYIPKDFDDPSINISYTYSEIIKLLTLGEADLMDAKEYLSQYFITDLEQIPCYYFVKRMNFFKDTFIEYASPYYAFVHEYVHYITCDYNMTIPTWLIEGIATYIQYYIPGRLIYICNEYSVKEIREEEPEGEYLEFITLYDMHADTKNDIQDIAEFGIASDISAYLHYNNPSFKFTINEVYNRGIQEGGFISYKEAASIINYLIMEYGSDTFFSLYKGEITLEDAYGKDLEGLYEEWGEYITLKFSY